MTAIREEYQVMIPTDAPISVQSSFNQLNDILHHLQQLLAKIQGLDNLTPEFVNDADFGGNKILSLAAGTEDSDGVRRYQVAIASDALAPSLITQTNAAQELASVTDLTAWIASGTGINVADDGDGSVTLTIGGLTVTIHVANAVLTLADMYQVHIFNSAADLTCTLPSVDATNLMTWVTVIRMGAGEVRILAADADTILDSSAGGSIFCDDPVYDNCSFTPILITATEWGAGRINFGRWGTQ